MDLIKRLVYKNLKLNKKRTIVTIVGIILSASLLVALATLVSSFQKSLVLFEKQKSGDYHLGFTDIGEDEAKEIEKNRKIEGFYKIKDIGYSELIESKNPDKPYLRVVSTDKKGLESCGIKLLEGRMPQSSDEIVIPRHLKTNGRVIYNIGDRLELEIGHRVSKKTGKAIGRSESFDAEAEMLIDTHKESYEIVGVIERAPTSVEDYACPGYTLFTYTDEIEGSADMYVRLTGEGLRNSMSVLGGIIGIDKELISRIDIDDMQADQTFMEEFTKKIADMPFGVEVNNWLIQYERVWPIDRSIAITVGIAGVVAIIIVVTSVYCIKNSFEISISEKVRQYGMLASIGATRKQIKKSVYTEAGIMGMIGIPLGVLFGNLASVILVKVCNLLLNEIIQEIVYYPSIPVIIIAVLISSITVYLSAMGSARKAAKVTPMEAIRNQREIKLSARKLKVPKLIQKLWGIGGVISYKNIKRNNKKYRTTTVSIIIGTVTFIVITYFTSMVFNMVALNYSTERANIKVDIVDVISYDKLEREIRTLDNIDEYNIITDYDVYNENIEFTDEYNSYLDDMYVEDEYKNVMTILCLDDAGYKEYAKANGISADDEKIILVNNLKFEVTDENGNNRSGECNMLKAKKGDVIKIRDVNEDNPKAGKDYELEIAGIASKRPIGEMDLNTSAQLVASRSTISKLNLVNDGYVNVNIITEKADQIQNEIEDLLEQNDNNGDIRINNRDKNRKEERNLYLVLAIFAYGLVIVIALIGITNIINTLGTSMELRSREFATLRSIGMTDAQFKKMVRLESFFTGARSLFFGNLFGLIISYLINYTESKYDTVIIFHPPLKACLISIVVVMALIYIIIRSSLERINKRNIIETIKNENL